MQPFFRKRRAILVDIIGCQKAHHRRISVFGKGRDALRRKCILLRWLWQKSESIEKTVDKETASPLDNKSETVLIWLWSRSEDKDQQVLWVSFLAEFIKFFAR